MEDCLKVTKIIKNKNRIEYFYEMEGKWNNLLKTDENMFIEYDNNIENIPDSIAVIPLLCNILPISWVFNLTIKVKNMDKSFYDCLKNVKKGYADMYPMLKILGNLQCENIEKNEYKSMKIATFYSGGIDSFNTLFNHIHEKPTLLTVWGADVKLDDQDGWNKVKLHNANTAQQFNLDSLFIKTNFRTFINYYALTAYVSEKVEGEWWHEFQHGIGMIGLVAPVAYINKIGTLYIASSFAANYKGKYTCASDPTIDNYVKMASCQVVHDGYEYSRQDKIYHICKYLEDNKEKLIPVRVCWKSSGGENCCECEKCYRTIMGIIAEGKNPNHFGFDFTSEKRKKMMKKLPKYVKYNFVYAYSDIQERFIQNYSIENTPEDLMWFRKMKIRDGKPKFILLWKKTIRRVKRMIKKYLINKG